ncbi:GTPase family protein [Methylomarinum vadi]|uniref:GTPase family protein n=1 Tax=Methylomarinum vadi TaxID=438855 RepID=UPI001363AD7E|nr:GTPase [Methylomarinum vadi]
MTRWAIEVTLLFIPLLVLIVAGLYWLWLSHWFWIWLVSSVTIGMLLWLWDSGRCRKKTSIKHSVDDSDNAGVWRKIDGISERRINELPDLVETQFYIDTFVEVVQTVAEHYHPEQKEALLEVRIPYILAIIEMVAKDLRIGFSENVPGSHIVTLSDIVKGQRLASQGLELYQALRLVFSHFNPFTATVGEAAGKQLYAKTVDEIKREFIDSFIRRVGHYAIELYSENLALNNDELAACIDRKTESDWSEIREREHRLEAEPLRILVMGQTNAGKSSLINALFGEIRAETDVIASTAEITPYWIERPGLDAAIILDCEGYGGEGDERFISEVIETVTHCDMVLLVLSAVNAAREPDSDMIQRLRHAFASNRRAKIPPVIAVLTHIDQLRPVREWQPPYNIVAADSVKASMIRQAIEMVAKDLQIRDDQVAAVSLLEGREYNIEEGLIPTILQQLEQARRIRYTRCMKNYHKEDYWRRLWLQSKNAGRFIVKKGFSAFDMN